MAARFPLAFLFHQSFQTTLWCVVKIKFPIPERRKAGFLVPLEAWMQSAWQPLLRQHLTEQFAADSGWLHWPVLHEMIEAQAARREDYAYPLFALLVLALWWRIWITGEMPVAALRPPAVPTIVQRLAEREGGP